MKNDINVIYNHAIDSAMNNMIQHELYSEYIHKESSLSESEKLEYYKFICNRYIKKEKDFCIKTHVIVNNKCYVIKSNKISYALIQYKCITTDGKEAENIINIILSYIKIFKNNFFDYYDKNFINIYNNKYTYDFSNNYSILNIYFYLDKSDSFKEIINLEELMDSFYDFAKNSESNYDKLLHGTLRDYFKNNTLKNKSDVSNAITTYINFGIKLSNNIYYCFYRINLCNYCGKLNKLNKKKLLEMKKMKNELNSIIINLLDNYKLTCIINNFKTVVDLFKNSNYSIEYNSIEEIGVTELKSDLDMIDNNAIFINKNKNSKEHYYFNACYVLI